MSAQLEPQWKPGMTGSDLIAEFVAQKCFSKVFVVNGGACAFMIDAVGRNADADIVCVQHEQAAAMAADAVWRTIGQVGVTMATSGPGATNLITGIASSWFDSIPTMHITGQVNARESKTTIGVDVRQAGFQETDIVSMVSKITKFATQPSNTTELADALAEGLGIAVHGRMGPVLIDVPMNVQQESVSEADFKNALRETQPDSASTNTESVANEITQFLEGAERPLAIFGGGLGLARTTAVAQRWCEENSIPYIASWAGLTYVDRSMAGFQGAQGVYGSRHANWTVQAADRILVFGSRLDNRQRTGHSAAYAPFAQIHVLDVDSNEIKKFHANPQYTGSVIDLSDIEPVLTSVQLSCDSTDWFESLQATAVQNPSGREGAVNAGELNPYLVVEALQRNFQPNTLVAADTGATLCWLFQAYSADDSLLFTAGGNSPMGYSLPAAIGAKLADPNRPVVCVIGDGGFQMNLQELQTAVAYGTPISIVVFNNSGYGIIKQFQDANTDGRYFASGTGYTVPNLEAIAQAYGIDYQRIDSVEDIRPDIFTRGLTLIEVVVPQNALVIPKVEGNHFIHDQFPYRTDQDSPQLPYSYPARPSELAVENTQS